MNEQQRAAMKLALAFLQQNQQYIVDNERHAYVMLYNDFVNKLEDIISQDIISQDAPPKQDVPETNFGNMAQPDYAWPTIEDYEKEVGFEVNDAFKAAWTMARTTNDLFKQMGETK
jgi:hypothetical protein